MFSGTYIICKVTQYNLKGDYNKLKIHMGNPKATNENIKHELYAANKQIKETNGILKKYSNKKSDKEKKEKGTEYIETFNTSIVIFKCILYIS